jgi:hypothetical protein
MNEEEKMSEACSAHGEMRNTFCSEDLGVYGRIIFKCILGKEDRRAETGFMCLGTGTGGGLL